jgi:hypothetical protein
MLNNGVVTVGILVITRFVWIRIKGSTLICWNPKLASLSHAKAAHLQGAVSDRYGLWRRKTAVFLLKRAIDGLKTAVFSHHFTTGK